MNNRKQIVIRDFFDKYDDACDVTHRQYRLDYKTYRKILKLYFEIIKDALIDGDEIELGKDMGTIITSCYTVNKQHPVLGNLRPVTFWKREDEKLKFKYFWRFYTTRYHLKKRLQSIADNPVLINKYQKH